MARQLGQFLLASGAISGDQLEVALEAQMRFGGRLGFNLVAVSYTHLTLPTKRIV